MQVYHSNATTNIHIRKEIKNSNLTNTLLTETYSVSQNTIRKWKNRTTPEDKSSTPQKINYSLTDYEKELLVVLRKLTWLSLDEITETVFPDNPVSKRSAVYRLFVKHKINKKPQKEKDKSHKFKEYEPGYLHFDVTYLPKINGIKQYLFVAIDRATRSLYFKVYDAKTAENANEFLSECINFFPFKISHILTDNGLEFTNKVIKSKKGETCKKQGLFDQNCSHNGIEHRCTKPATPKTNGMVEKANDIIKSGTIKKYNYNSKDTLTAGLMAFLVNYNLYRRHGSLRKELKVKTPFNAVEKWYEINPDIFKEKPCDFKTKILLLNAGYHQQPCET